MSFTARKTQRQIERLPQRSLTVGPVGGWKVPTAVYSRVAPASPLYGLGHCAPLYGFGSYRRRRGLGQPPGYLEVCNSGIISTDYQCAQRNIQRQIEYYAGTADLNQNQISDYAEYHGGDTPQEITANTLAAQQLPPGSWSCYANACVNATTGAVQYITGGTVPTTTTVQTTTPGAPVYTPRVLFQPARGGSTLYPGDAWTITLTGAPPNAQIKVRGGKNGANDEVVMGSADASGNFRLAGTASSAELGTWNETWTAGGINAGSFSFTIVSGPGGTTSTTTTAIDPIVTTPGGGGSVVPSGTVTTGSSGGGGALEALTGDSIISGIPTWLLLAGGFVAYKFATQK